MNIEVQNKMGQLLRMWEGAASVPRVGDEIVIDHQLLTVARVTWHTAHYVCLLTEARDDE